MDCECEVCSWKCYFSSQRPQSCKPWLILIQLSLKNGYCCQTLCLIVWQSMRFSFHSQPKQKKSQTPFVRQKTCPTGRWCDLTGTRIKKRGLCDLGISETTLKRTKWTCRQRAVKRFFEKRRNGNYRELQCFVLMVITHNHDHQQKSFPAIMVNGLHLLSALALACTQTNRHTHTHPFTHRWRRSCHARP